MCIDSFSTAGKRNMHTEQACWRVRRRKSEMCRKTKYIGYSFPYTVSVVGVQGCPINIWRPEAEEVEQWLGPLSVNPEGQSSIARIHFREVINPCKPTSNRSDTFVQPLHAQACLHTNTAKYWPKTRKHWEMHVVFKRNTTANGEGRWRINKPKK